MSSHGDEYLVTVPKNLTKQYNVMKFNSGDKVDIRKWMKAHLSRDMSAKKIYDEDDAFPEFGEGSEYGRKQREEARKLKYGKKTTKFKTENQPWNLTVSTIEELKDDKKFADKDPVDIKPAIVRKNYHGRKEGGIGEGSVYFVFTQRPDFTFEAYPIDDWCNFSRKISHRTLTDEEAEAAWDKRDKILNHLNYMARKRLHIHDDEALDTEDVKVKKEKDKKSKQDKLSDLLIHDVEDIDYMSESDGEENEAKPSNNNKKRKEEENSEKEDEPQEDSDDGEHEGTEIAYASDISSENEEVNDNRIAPRGLDELDSSSSSEEEEKDDGKDPVIAKAKNNDGSGSSADSDSDIDADDSLCKSALFMQPKKSPTIDKKSGKVSKHGSRPSTPTIDSSSPSGSPKSKSNLQSISRLDSQSGTQSPLAKGNRVLGKRAASRSPSLESQKRQKLSVATSGSITPIKELQQGITEDAVFRVLTHKPITTKDLLKKFKTKRTGLESKQIVEKVADILKKLNPQKISMNGKMHLYLKSS